MISWNFPGNQDGQVKGVADAGIENFNGTELSSLARENCQNSLDATLDDTDPEAAKNELLGEAVKDSMTKANVLATAANVKLGNIVNIDYSWGEVDFVSRPLEELSLRCCEDTCEPASYNMDIEPDDIDMADTVTVVWNIA